MSVAEVNFSFNGLHCMRDFGCIYIESSNGRTISPKTTRNEYSIAGMSGTVLLGDRATHDAYNSTGVLVPMQTPKTLRAAQDLARRVAAWLKEGRGVLTWDYEPAQLHYAEVLQAITWDTKAWMDGGINVTFQVQPYTYDLSPTIERQAIAAGTSTMLVPVVTGEPCPVSIKLTNTGSKAITHARITTARGAVVEFAKGMSLAVGSTLRLDMEPPIGAAIVTGTAETNALRYATRFDQLTLGGPEILTIELDEKAEIVATARGCAL